MSAGPWQWVSFADGKRPAGTQFLGVVIIRAVDIVLAARACHALGINPGGEVMCHPIPDRFGDPPPEFVERLITDRAELERLSKIWTGVGVSTVGELDDANAH